MALGKVSPIVRYEDWVAQCLTDKKEIASFMDSETHAVHSIRRYLGPKMDHIWEVGFTYTGRLVVRVGLIGQDGVQVAWGDWETQHEVEIPRSG